MSRPFSISIEDAAQCLVDRGWEPDYETARAVLEDARKRVNAAEAQKREDAAFHEGQGK